MEINVFSGLEVHCVRPYYQQNDFVIGFSLHSVKTLLLAAQTIETKARLGINSGNSLLNRNEWKIQRTLYKNDDIFAVLKHQNNRHFRFLLRLMETASCLCEHKGFDVLDKP